MNRFGKTIVKLRIPILILALLLIVPSLYGMAGTRINYDMLTYLPEDLDTIAGQNILMDDFGKGAFSLVMVEDMDVADVAALKTRLEGVEHVDSVLWYDDLFDLSVPMEMLPRRFYEAFNAGNATMMAIFFDTSTSEDATMAAIHDIRDIAGRQCFVSGMSALVTDLKDLCEREEPVYVGLAVALATLAMMVFMDNWLVPFLFLASIGLAILANMGTNYFLGEISYLTKALSAVLQLAVTMDYSIFLWHSYEEKKAQALDRNDAMAEAIGATLTSVVGSSLTTVAGFVALCFMTFTLGRDLGIVMAKGVLLGVVGCVTTLPALILLFERPLQRASHRPLVRRTQRLASFVTHRAYIFLVVFAVLAVPAAIGYSRTNSEVYYDLGQCLPDDMEYVQGNDKLTRQFGIGSTHMLLLDADLPQAKVKAMKEEMERVDGVQYVLGLKAALGSGVPVEMLPDSLRALTLSGGRELMLVNSQYLVASDEVNRQIDELNAILKRYDATGMLIGEAPCSKDMIEVTDVDFKVVSAISIAAVFLIILLVTKSLSLPVILVSVIEFAVFVNLGIPHYTGVALPFVAPICISTIQLGSTVDYAILMTTRYKQARNSMGKREAVADAVSASVPSIMVSALGFFAATFGVALYSNVDIISSMCTLMARGAVVSMLSVIFILPSLLTCLDPLIRHTSLGFRKEAKAR